MINLLMLIVAIACFTYGMYALFTPRLPGKESDGIAEGNKRRFSKICGVVMLVEAAIMGTGFYMEVTGLPYSRVAFLGFIGVLVCVLTLAKKLLSK